MTTQARRGQLYSWEDSERSTTTQGQTVVEWQGLLSLTTSKTTGTLKSCGSGTFWTGREALFNGSGTETVERDEREPESSWTISKWGEST